MKKKTVKLEHKEWLSAYLFIAPLLIVFIPFRFFPMFFNVILSFGEWDPFTNEFSWVALKQYQHLARDGGFILGLKNTFFYVAGVLPTTIIIGLGAALLLSKKLPLRTFGRAAFFLPYISTLVATAAIWRWLYDPTSGLINGFLKIVGLPTSLWLSSGDTAMVSVIIFGIWQMVGYSVVIYLGGLLSIPYQYYEAARIDGANRFRSFFQITLPLLKPITLFILVMYTVTALRAFDQLYIMTGGGPAEATTTLMFYVYRQAFYFIKYSYAATLSVILVAIALAVTLVEMKLLRSR